MDTIPNEKAMDREETGGGGGSEIGRGDGDGASVRGG